MDAVNDAAQHRFQIGGAERARIDSSGRLLVGTSTARGNFLNSTSAPRVQIEGTSTDGGSLALITSFSSATNGAAPILQLGRAGSTAIGSDTIVANNNYLGQIIFSGNDGSEFVSAASIDCQVDGTPSANDLPGRLVFSTTADGAASPTERMRISANGNIDYGAFSATPASGTQGRSYSDSGRFCRSSIGSADPAPHHEFYNTNGAVGSIQTDGSATSYNTSSDYRLKENVVEVTDGITRLQQLKPSRFNFIVDPDKTVDGFIAHEAQAVVPECVTGEKDAVDADGNPVYQGIDQSKLVPLLTAALQEAIAKIESLEARLTAAGL